MPQLDHRALQPHIAAIEEQRNSRVLVLAASHLETELLPGLYEQCVTLGRCPRLDVVLHGRGGAVNAARRIALLLRQQADHLAFIVPYHCQSAATLLTLCADEVLAGPLAQFSPIDPQLTGQDGTAFSSEDIHRFGEMAQNWFGIAPDEARTEGLSLLCRSVFAPSLAAFYRVTLEVQQIGEELLAFQLADRVKRSEIVRRLMSGYHSHHYALTREEMEAFGLRLRSLAGIEAAAWAISRQLQAHLGGAQRGGEDEPWCDALFATRAGLCRRIRQPGGMAGAWVA